jgi:cation:H+ antiporter
MDNLPQLLSAVVAGFFLLVWSASRFIHGASAIARNLNVSPLIIGLTIVGFGTSAPEMLVSAIAALEGSPQLGVGNALGSNITNIGLVLGLTAIIMPLGVHSDTLRREFPVLIAITLIAVLLLVDSHLSRIDGTLLLIGMAALIYWTIKLGLQTRTEDPLKAEYSVEIPQQIPMLKALFWTVLGFAVLLVSSRMVVWGATGTARIFGVSELVIGLTIVAFGTSLPELAASIISALKKEHDIAIGNILGSNMFNLLGVLGIAGVIKPANIDNDLLYRDLPFVIGFTFALFIMAYGFRGPGRINRYEGGTLACAFFIYMYIIYLTST